MAVRVDPGWRIAAAGLAWMAGVGTQLQQAEAWPPTRALAVGLLAAALALWLGTRARWRSGLPTTLGMTLALAVAALAYAHGRADVRLAQRLDPALEGVDLLVTGVIAEMPRLGAGGTRFVFDVDPAPREGGPGVRVPSRLSLGWYAGPDSDAATGGALPAVVAGDRWQFTVRLKRPHGNFNPAGFDLELWLFEQGIGATGSVRPGAQRLAQGSRWGVERMRQSIRDALLVQVPDPLAAGVLAALAIGDQAAIDREGWDLFRITGVAHLMSISGLHVTMFAWLAGLAITGAWRRSGRGVLACPAPTAGRWGGLACAAAYALLAGWGVPAQRTVLMLATVVVLRSLAVRWPQPLVLLTAGVAVSVADPWALLQPGFWLSFVAVALLLGSDPVNHPGPPSRGWRARVAAELRSQSVATVGLAPLTLVFFQQVSVVGFLANLVAIPLVTLLITPLALLGVLLPALWQPAAWGVQALHAGLSVLARWPLAQWTAAAAPPWAMAAGLLGGALLILPWPWRLRLLGLPWCCPCWPRRCPCRRTACSRR